MIPVDQEIVNRRIGDCLTACVASLLEKELQEVPFFAAIWVSALEINEEYKIYPSWWRIFKRYFEKNGYEIEESRDEEAMKVDPGINGYVIVNGESMTFEGGLHSVIYKDGVLVHDPNPSRKGIKKFTSYYVVRKKEQ